jgi:hypothetical protein
MSDDLTPERAREMLNKHGTPGPRTTARLIAAWERDRAELLERRRSCATCGATNLHADGIHSCYDRNALTAEYYQCWQDACDRLATVLAQRDALARIAAFEVEEDSPLPYEHHYVEARAALAAIRAEQTTITEDANANRA